MEGTDPPRLQFLKKPRTHAGGADSAKPLDLQRWENEGGAIAPFEWELEERWRQTAHARGGGKGE